jgi:hypothetical protein
MAYNNTLRTNNLVEVKLSGNLDIPGFVGLMDEVRDWYKKFSLPPSPLGIAPFWVARTKGKGGN